MLNDRIAENLDQFLTEELEYVTIPSVVNGCIKIRNFTIVSNDNKFYIYNRSNICVACTYFKSTALAITKQLAFNKEISKTLLNYDQELIKLHNESLFYENILKNSTDFETISIIETRLELSNAKAAQINKKLEKVIFGIA